MKLMHKFLESLSWRKMHSMSADQFAALHMRLSQEEASLYQSTVVMWQTLWKKIFVWFSFLWQGDFSIHIACSCITVNISENFDCFLCYQSRIKRKAMGQLLLARQKKKRPSVKGLSKGGYHQIGRKTRKTKKGSWALFTTKTKVESQLDVK